MNVPEQVEKVVDAVESAGGRACLIGGAVADLVCGREPADWDIEVYGLTTEAVEDALEPFSPKRVGRCHEVWQMSVDGVDIDVNLPVRRNGAGLDEADPFMSPEDAARRRDFTMNAMFMDLGTGRLFDPFGGGVDAQNRRLRITDDQTFREDPLRGLRAMQLAARKAPHLDYSSLLVLSDMATEVNLWEYPAERILEEWRKLLLKAERPSIGLRFIKASGWLRFFPELAALVDVKQNPKYHPEGDVWEHTLFVLDAAAAVRHNIEDEKEREAFMWAALGHDLGKAKKTQADLSAPGHDRASGPLLRTFLERMTNCERKVIGPAVKLAENHMRPRGLFDGGARPSRWKVLADDLAPASLETMGWLSRSDWAGSRPWGERDPLNAPKHAVSALCWEYHKKLASRHGKVKPIIDGRKLIAAGHTPGPGFREALDAALKAQVDGLDDEAALLEVAVAALEGVQ